jgi:hypothetical protein
MIFACCGWKYVTMAAADSCAVKLARRSAVDRA